MKNTRLTSTVALLLILSPLPAHAVVFPLIPVGIKAGVGGMAMLYSTVTGMYIISAATAAYYAGAATFTVLGTVYVVSDYLDKEGRPLEEK